MPPIVDHHRVDELDPHLFRKINAQLSYYMHIPHPEQLPDDLYWDKWEQLKWVRAKESNNG